MLAKIYGDGEVVVEDSEGRGEDYEEALVSKGGYKSERVGSQLNVKGASNPRTVTRI